MVGIGQTHRSSDKNNRDDPQSHLMQPSPVVTATYRLPWPLMGPLFMNDEARNTADNWIENQLVPRLEGRFGSQAVRSNMVSTYWPGLFDKAMVLDGILLRYLKRENGFDMNRTVSEVLSGQTSNGLHATVATGNAESLINLLVLLGAVGDLVPAQIHRE